MSDSKQPIAAEKTVKQSESIESQEGDRLEKYFDEIFELFGLLKGEAKNGRQRQEVRGLLKGAITKAVMNAEPQLRNTEYWENGLLGRVTYIGPDRKEKKIDFRGLSSVLNNIDGVVVQAYEPVQAAGDSPATLELKEKHIEIPDDVLMRAVQMLRQWSDDVDMIPFNQDDKEAFGEYSDIEELQQRIQDGEL